MSESRPDRPALPRPPQASPPAGPTPPRRWSSVDLLEGRREVEIEHHQVIYRLQLTALGKLILTK